MLVFTDYVYMQGYFFPFHNIFLACFNSSLTQNSAGSEDDNAHIFQLHGHFHLTETTVLCMIHDFIYPSYYLYVVCG